MKMTMMRKVLVVIWMTGLALILTATAAFAWNAATHAYIEEHFYKKQGQVEIADLYNRIYGANAVDIFTDNFTSPYLEFSAFLHDTSRENFLQVWQLAASRDEKAFAYGFVGHNNTWGMDSTAHVSGITYGRGQGYIIAKARVLAAMIRPALESQLGQTLPDNVMVDVCHYLVESGVDFLVRAKDPAIGNKLIAAALYRSNAVPALLIDAYKDDFSALAGSPDNAAQIIATAEGNFRFSMMGYGWALTQDNALDLVADGLASIGVKYLGLPPGSEAALVPVAKQGIAVAMMLCAPDFEKELKATTGWVNGKLSAAGVTW
jgi:hypothetical protein